MLSTYIENPPITLVLPTERRYPSPILNQHPPRGVYHLILIGNAQNKHWLLINHAEPRNFLYSTETSPVSDIFF